MHKLSSTGSGVKDIAIKSAALCLAYYVGSVLGFSLTHPSSELSTIWLPNTLLLVALLLSNTRYWPWLLVVAFPAHAVAHVQFGEMLSQAALFYAYDCILVLLTAAALRRFSVADCAVGGLRQVVIFIGVTAATVAVTSALAWPLVGSLLSAGDPLKQWSLLFLANFFPFLAATPCLVIGLTRGRDISRSSLARRTEFVFLTAALLVSGTSVFGALEVFGTGPALFLAPLPVLLWAAMRFGPGGLSCLFFAFSLMAMSSTVAGQGPFVNPASDSIIGLQVFLLSLYIPLYVLASVVEERRAQADALRRSEARYRGVVEDQTELICRLLPDGTYTFVNDAYCEYFQSSREELIGKSFWQFLPAAEQPAVREFLSSITPANSVATIEHEVIGPDNERRWQQWRDRGFFDESGQLLEYQAVGRDITERKLAEAAIRANEAALRISYERVRELTGRLISAQEAERARVARELHDDVNQQLAALSISLSRIKRLVPPTDLIHLELTALQQQAGAIARATRHLSHELHPGVLLHAGVVAALRGSCADFGNLHKVEVEFRADEGVNDIPADVAVCLCRVTQEALHNTARHASARRLEVALTSSVENSVELRIADDGRGFDVAEVRKHGGLGLTSIDERVRLVGGSVSILSAHGRGTELRVRVPRAPMSASV